LDDNEDETTINIVVPNHHVPAMENASVFEDVFEHLPSSIFCCDAEFRILVVNHHFCKFVEREKNNCIGQLLASVLPQAFKEKVLSATALLDDTVTLSEFEMSVDLGMGQPEYFAVCLQAFLKECSKGNRRIVGSIHDVTRMRKHEGSIAEEHELLRTVIDILPAFIYAKDKDSKFIIANEVLAGYMGCKSSDELIGKTDFDFFPHKYAMKYYCDEQEVIYTGKPKLNIQESCGFNEEMEPIWLNTTKVPFRDADGTIVGIVGTGMDVTNQKKVNDQLYELQEIVNNSNVCAFLLSSYDNWVVSYCSSTVSNFGYTKEDFSNRKINFQEIVHPEDVKSVVEDTLSYFREGFDNFTQEYRIKMKDGSYCWVEDQKHLRETLKDGSFLFQSLITDVSLKHKFQKERDEMEIQLRQAQKLEAVGQLAAGIAHEINTPIQFISDNLQFLMDSANDFMSFYKGVMTDLDKTDKVQLELLVKFQRLAGELDLNFLSEEVPTAISQSLEGARRVRDIVQAMKDFSHPGSGEITHEDLNKAIQSTITVARNEWKYVADMETELDASITSVPLDVGPIKQTILNLIVNAAHAIEDRVKAGDYEKGVITVRSKTALGKVVIEIQDTGKGMSPKVAQRVFDPFFTTKEVGKGTGQGLSLAYDIVVRKHKGKLYFDTKEGVGTTFFIELPRDVE